MSGPDVVIIPLIGIGLFAIVVAIMFGRQKRKPPTTPVSTPPPQPK